MNKLEKQFERLVYPYIGSSFMTGDESQEVIQQNSKTCADIVEDVAIQFAKMIDINSKPVISAEAKDIIRKNPDNFINNVYVQTT